MDWLDYHLPPDRIAQTPLTDRAASKMLHLGLDGSISHRGFRDLPSLLEPGDLLVFNDTRVTARRLFGRKPTGGLVELLLLREVESGSGHLAFICLAKPGRRLKPGARVLFDTFEGVVEEEPPDGLKLIRFQGPEILRELLDAACLVPLPPYIHETLADPERYQTVYAQAAGSAAAPTAGLHFTPELLDELGLKGVEFAHVTLDVSLDTFRPIETEDPLDHKIHGETCRISPEASEKISRARGRIIGVGTTSVRTLESFAAGKRRVEAGEKDTKLFITPGYEFKVIDGMLTNFHMPRTTMLLMLAALAGEANVAKAYREALAGEYRFLSFGDPMLIL